MPITGKILTEENDLGPIPWTFLREFWAYGLIPAGTLISLKGAGEPVAIELCEKLNKFPKAFLSKVKWFRGGQTAWQKCPNSEVQQHYLKELGWPFQTDTLTYHQADFLRGRLETIFPTRRRPFIDPENPWSPGSTTPLEGDYRIEQPPDKRQIGFLRFLGIDLPPYFSIESNSWEALRLIKKNSSLEAFDDWVQKYYWGNLRPTGRQLKVLKFFGMKNTHIVANRAHANTLISGLFSNEKNLDRWEKYKRLTGDYHDDDPNLREFDPEALKTNPT
jgi:hypothetical protein